MEALIGDESSECEQELSINEDYAKKYTKWREKEELQKLKDRYGEDGLRDSSSESSSSEEEEEVCLYIICFLYLYLKANEYCINLLLTHFQLLFKNVKILKNLYILQN
ncbi:protein kri1-like, partial [Centruroides sculpturatus]|uniref:protein kri1-like n=1 Tax=Centruroides sculpturatus TaxID=218467 RepID=UPI000C6EA5B8